MNNVNSIKKIVVASLVRKQELRGTVISDIDGVSLSLNNNLQLLNFKSMHKLRWLEKKKNYLKSNSFFFNYSLVAHNLQNTQNITFLSSNLRSQYNLKSSRTMWRMLQSTTTTGNSNRAGIFTRTYAAFFGGRPMPQSHIASTSTESDMSRRHAVAAAASCNKDDCLEKDCISNPEDCVTPSVPLGQPNTGGETGLKFNVVGALTHTIPKSGYGVEISQYDFSGVRRTQKIVLETSLPEIDSSEFVLEKPVTAFLQDPQNTKNLFDAKTKDGCTLKEAIEKIK